MAWTKAGLCPAPAKGPFLERIGACANSAKLQSDIRRSSATFAFGKFAQLGSAELYSPKIFVAGVWGGVFISLLTDIDWAGRLLIR